MSKFDTLPQVLEDQNLVKKDFSGLSDPYVVLTYNQHVPNIMYV